jgi:hypothetical protein
MTQAVTGGSRGIDARNFGNGALSIVAHGGVEGTNYAGIYARQNKVGGAGPLSITTESKVTGGSYGIRALNNGTGATTITANGDVTGGNRGIHVFAGALSIVARGDVVGTNYAGIYAWNNDTASTGPLSITTEAKVTGGVYGIVARNYGRGALEIVANGDVTGIAGIYARNYYGTGPTNITVGSGATVSGDTGVAIVDGVANTLNNYGHVRSLRPLTGVAVAISGDAGDETVNNFGVVTGDVLLGLGTDTFNNMPGARFNPGTTVYLGFGPADVLINHGILSPGGAGSILTTRLFGGFSQPGSELEIDVQGANADQLIVSNGSAALAGKVRPLFTLSGLGSFTRWTVLTGLIIDNGIEAVDTAAVDFGLIFPTSRGWIWRCSG